MKYCLKLKNNHSPSNKHFEGASEGFFLSRLALSEISNLPFNPKYLEIENHLQLEKKPELLASLSHTKGIGAAAVMEKGETLSIGIDIEHSSRKMKTNSKRFFRRREDEESLSDLELWCLKEAIFKACSPYYQGEKTLVLKDFWIKNNQFGHFEWPKKKLGQCQIKVEDEVIIATARLLCDRVGINHKL